MFAALAHTSSGRHGSVGFYIVGIAFIVIGAAQLVKPDLSYRMSRWQYKNKEALQPSHAALVVARIAGAIGVVVGVVLLVTAVNR